MLWMSPALTAWAVISLPFVAITGFFMARGMYPYFRERQEAMANVTSFTQENLNGIRTIQAMAQEDNEVARFKRTSTVYAQKFLPRHPLSAVMDVAMTSLTTIAPLIILFYGGSLVLARRTLGGHMDGLQHLPDDADARDDADRLGTVDVRGGRGGHRAHLRDPRPLRRR